MRLGMTVLLLSVAVTPLAAEGGFEYWPAAKLKSYSSSLKARADKKTGMGSEQLGNYGNFTSMVARRDQNGQPEVHADWSDIFIAHDGEATLIYGGKVEGGKETQPGEMRSGKIVGGKEQKLGPGDMAVIPAGMPHQTNPAAGKPFTYMVIKVKK